VGSHGSGSGWLRLFKPRNTTPNYSSFTTAPTKIQLAAAYLEKSLFIRAGELITRVTVAAKDANGKIYWVNLDPAYHSMLVKTAIDVIKTNGPKHSMASIKKALFIVLLDVLNGKPQAGFFTLKEAEGKSTRTNPRHKQPTHKQSQPSKRERHSRGHSTDPHLYENDSVPLNEPMPILKEKNDGQCTDGLDDETPPASSDDEHHDFWKLLHEMRRRETLPAAPPDPPTHITTTSPTERWASQVAHHPQGMKRIINDEPRYAKVAITQAQAHKPKTQGPSIKAT